VLALSFALGAVLAAAQPAAASFHHMKVREVRTAGAAGSYVELQMWEGGQNLVSGHVIKAYTATGAVDHEYAMTGNVGSGTNQKTVLIAGPGYSGPAADFTDASLNLPAAGGAVCFADSEPPDCVSWGNFTGNASLPSSAGTPESAGGVTAGKALLRSIAGATGCATMLEPTDDTNDSAADFSEQDPHPRPNSAAVEETECTLPSVIIDTKPATKTNSTSASFTFHSSPAGAPEFDCKLDSGEFEACDSGSKNYPGPLAAGSHTFQVKATNASGTGNAASHTWEIDLMAPTASISNPKPPNPNSGKSVTFKYTSNENNSTFQCSLAKGAEADSFSSCNQTGKTYSNLTDGNYTFKVKAKDPAGNEGGPAGFEFEVDTSLADITPPDTKINSKPADPSNSTTAEFTYESTEANSTFECKMDGESFGACPAVGKTHTGLGAGPHTFQVRATDESLNTDESPAGYSFSIVLPVQPEIKPPEEPKPPPPAVAPNTTITSKPKAKTKDRTPTFKFKSSVPGSTYECKLDGKALRPCRSPLTTKPLKFGRHTLKVAATAGGLKDGSPAVASFKVVKPK
jgi:hypothetical protein